MPINPRLLNLFIVLRYESQNYEYTGNKILTKGQRICINQERAYLMQYEYLSDNDSFPQPEIIHEKVDFILEQIRAKNKTENLLEYALSTLNYYI